MKLNYGEALKQQRKINGLTQQQLSKATGIVQPNISAWENNLYTPNIDFCVQLADYYGITLDELVGRDFPQNDSNKKNTINNHTVNISIKN